MRSFNIAISLLLGSAFTGLCYADEATANPTPTQMMPAHCTTKSRYAAAITHSCYTATAYTTPLGGCERLECTKPKEPVACPQIVRETVVTVPCATDCCPTTPTTYITTACPTPCPRCPIPTYTQTITTGCPK